MLRELENQAGAVTTTGLVAAEGVMGARPFGIAGDGSGSEVADMFAGQARDGRERVDRRGENSFSIELRVLFEGGFTKEPPGHFPEPIGELEFAVIEGG